MILIERKLNQSIFRKKILKELNYLINNYDLLNEGVNMNNYINSWNQIRLFINLNGGEDKELDTFLVDVRLDSFSIQEAKSAYDPKAINPVDYKDNIPLEIVWAARDIVDNQKEYLHFQGNTESPEFITANRIVQKYPLSYYQLDSVSLKLQYISWMWENDRFHFGILLIDFASILDTTGLLDIGQGIALCCNGEYAAGILTMGLGVGTAVLNAYTGGGAGHVVRAAKVGIKVMKAAEKVAAKSAEKAAVEAGEKLALETAEKLVGGLAVRGPKYVQALQKSSQPAMQETAKILSRAVERAEAIDMTKVTTKNATQVIEEILGGSIPEAVKLKGIIKQSERQILYDSWMVTLKNAAKFQKPSLKLSWLLPAGVQSSAFALNVATTTAEKEVETKKNIKSERFYNDLASYYEYIQKQICKNPQDENDKFICNLTFFSREWRPNYGVDLASGGKGGYIFFNDEYDQMLENTNLSAVSAVGNKLNIFRKKMWKMAKENLPRFNPYVNIPKEEENKEKRTEYKQELNLLDYDSLADEPDPPPGARKN